MTIQLPDSVLAWFKTHLGEDKKRGNLLLALGLAGMLLLALSEWLPQKPASAAAPSAAQATAADADYAARLEARLAALLSRVEGVGQVRVMVTLAAGEQTVYARNTQSAADGSHTENYVVLGDGALTQSVESPTVQGVAVVCAGGGSSAVAARVTEIVAVLTDVGASHISVSKADTTE